LYHPYVQIQLAMELKDVVAPSPRSLPGIQSTWIHLIVVNLLWELGDSFLSFRYDLQFGLVNTLPRHGHWRKGAVLLC